MICRVRMPRRGPAGWRCKRSARRRPLPAAGCGFAGHARRLRAIGRQRSRRAARAAGWPSLSIPSAAPPAPAQRKPAWRRQRRRHLPPALVDRCLTLQIEIRLNCHILGRDGPFPISTSQGPCRFAPLCSRRPRNVVSRSLTDFAQRIFPAFDRASVLTFAEYALVGSQRGTILAPENHPAVSRNEAIVTSALPKASTILASLGQAAFVWDIATDAMVWSDHLAAVFPDIPAGVAGQRRRILETDRAGARGPFRRARPFAAGARRRRRALPDRVRGADLRPRRRCSGSRRPAAGSPAPTAGRRAPMASSASTTSAMPATSNS